MLYNLKSTKYGKRLDVFAKLQFKDQTVYSNNVCRRRLLGITAQGGEGPRLVVYVMRPHAIALHRP